MYATGGSRCRFRGCALKVLRSTIAATRPGTENTAPRSLNGRLLKSDARPGWLLIGGVVADDVATLHHEKHVLEQSHVAERITFDCDEIGERAGGKYTYLAGPAQ